ncbi:Sec20-domain-containing protein [Radiomyces spectabilis]|uniref:Sec20-domain-containing protein n=1 Tax=Radiomyces spectabilis TaxID=64574 RepID=UPI00222079FF|nr:Sec20-domain-containing protein [Radiomyces spectabilis]KAI8388820.1 Sec20-domain-containing protein [Radiomyces spectabilis]
MTIDTQFRSLSKLAAECQRHIQRLDLVDSVTVQKELTALLHSDLHVFDQDIQAIKQLADEEDREATKQKILQRLAEYETQLRHLRAVSRQAILKSKQHVQQLEKRNREELFGTASRINGKTFSEQFELKQRSSSGHDEAVLRASSDVTDALRRTSALMQQELEKSSYSTSVLADSSKTLSSTYREYQNFGSLLTISKRLIGQLETSDWFDRITLLLGFLFFTSVVLYIIKKRTWDVGISWISWLSGAQKSPLAVNSVSSLPSSSSSLVATSTVIVPQQISMSNLATQSIAWKDEL